MIEINMSVDSNNSEITFSYHINGLGYKISDVEAELALNLYEEIRQTISSLQIPIRRAANILPSTVYKRAEVLEHIKSQNVKWGSRVQPSYTIELRIGINDPPNKKIIDIKCHSSEVCTDREKEIAETILKTIQVKLTSI